MMKFLKLFPVVVVAGVLSGCCAGVGKIAEQLKDDPALVILDIRTIYGTAHLIRHGSPTNTLTIGPDSALAVNPKEK